MTANDADDHLPLKIEQEEGANTGFVNGLAVSNAITSTKEATEESSCSRKAKKKTSMTRGTRMIIMLSMTFAFFAVEMVCGYLSHSMALIADSFHMLSDVLALLIAFVCLKMSERSSKKNTFGWVRAEVLGALINGVFLLALCFSIAIESLTRLVEPEKIKEPRHVLVVGSIGLLINLIGMFMFHSHSHSHADSQQDAPLKPRSARRQTHVTIDGFESQHLMSSHQEGAMALAQLNDDMHSDLAEADSDLTEGTDARAKTKSKRKRGMSAQLNMRGVFLHVLSDAVGSVIVIVTALVSWLVPGHEILKLYLDPGLSLLMVLLLVASTFPLVRETALILMQTTPGFIEVGQLEKSLLKIDGVLAVHEFHVWRLVGERIIATVHIRFSDLKAYLAAADQIRTLFHDNCIHSTTIQPEFSEMVDTLGYNGSHCALACLPENCKRTDVTCCRRDSPPSVRERGTYQRGSGDNGSTCSAPMEQASGLDCR
uniref:Zinc transporter 1 n=1 Tax=Ascaris suum TaxID=6253 RepID=F1KXQ6_ASCSU